MIIGITGGLASGKTTVTRFFSKFDFKVINADKILHRLLNYKIRKRLRRLVFNDKTKFSRLEHLTHPFIIREIKQEIKHARKNKFDLVVDAPLLIEAGLDKLVDFVIVVKAGKGIQIKRANKSLNLGEKDAIKLINRQMPLKEKIKKADFVIDNTRGLENTKKQVKVILEKLKNKGDR